GKAPEEVNVIVLHLGNGASASAVRGGRCVDTSMGLTPLEGLVMGTRSGDMDPAVIFHLMRVGGMSADEIDTLLNKRSGLVGLCGDNDMREIRRRIDEGDEQAKLAFDLYIHRLKKYIGAYCAVLGRVDAVAFTAGVGENSAPVREAAVAGLEGMGLQVDGARNAVRGDAPRLISPEGARGAVAVVRTDEAMAIATQNYTLVGKNNCATPFSFVFSASRNIPERNKPIGSPHAPFENRLYPRPRGRLPRAARRPDRSRHERGPLQLQPRQPRRAPGPVRPGPCRRQGDRPGHRRPRRPPGPQEPPGGRRRR